MNSPAGPWKVAYEAVLRASAALRTAMDLPQARIYTDVPEKAKLPYVVIGDDQVIPESGEGCADEAEIFTTINLWSRTAPPDKGVQARAMGAAVIAALATDLAVAGWDVDVWEVQSERYSTDPDQSTHGVIVFRHLLTEQVA